MAAFEFSVHDQLVAPIAPTQPEMLDASATATGVALGGDRIEETPAQNRNYLNFVLVAPGVTSSNGGPSTIISLPSGGGDLIASR